MKNPQLRKRLKQSVYPEQFFSTHDYPEYQGEARLICIASTPRTGSHFLGHELETQKIFGFPLEYINRDNFKTWRIRFRASTRTQTIDEIKSHRTSENGWFTLKAHWHQFDTELGAQFASQFGGIKKLIHVYRENLLKQAISLATARQTGQWISGAKKRGEAYYDYDAIVAAGASVLLENIAWQSYKTQHGEIDQFTICYENFVKDKDSSLAGLIEFLDPDVVFQPVAGETTKVQSNQQAQNWVEQMRDDLKTEHQWIYTPVSEAALQDYGRDAEFMKQIRLYARAPS